MIPRTQMSVGKPISCHGLKVAYASVSSAYICATTGFDPARYGRTLAAPTRARVMASRSGESSVYPPGPIPSVKETAYGRSRLGEISEREGATGPTVR